MSSSYYNYISLEISIINLMIMLKLFINYTWASEGFCKTVKLKKVIIFRSKINIKYYIEVKSAKLR